MDSEDESCGFETDPGFCPDCGSILPLLGEQGGVTCYACKRVWPSDVFGDMSMTYTVNFNSIETYINEKKSKDGNEAEGPVVERNCAKCGNDQMSYATLQLRSADEGQTVFFTCTKCKYKETENS